MSRMALPGPRAALLAIPFALLALVGAPSHGWAQG